MPKLTLLVGPPGSGKSTYAQSWLNDEPASSDMARKIIISQDQDGKKHLEYFQNAVTGMDTYDILVDRMNFNKVQRERYLKLAKTGGYETEIVVLHESRETCITRGIERLYKEDHPTIKTEEDLRRAIGFFFKSYERPTEDEADIVTFKYPERSLRVKVIICDIDGTMANIEHRQHFVADGKKDWKNFLLDRNVEQDGINDWCRNITNNLRSGSLIVMCSGRPDTLEKTTKEWLEKHRVFYDYLFMRPRDDFRQDNVIKEIILDFEILTRFEPYFVLDDRDQVVQMWRNRGITCLQVAPGDF